MLLREGLIGLLGRCGHEVVAAVGDAQALIAAVGEHGPDIVVTDVRMPPGFQDEGLHAAVRLRESRPALPVQPGGLHDALEDARHVKVRFEALAERAYRLGLSV